MKKGFTLIELIIVIIIIGVLASLGLGQYVKVVEKGRAAEARMILGTLRTAEIAYYTEFQTYESVGNLGVSAPASCLSTHFFSYSCTTGTCTATRCTASGKTPQVAAADVYTKTLTPDGAWGGSGGY